MKAEEFIRTISEAAPSDDVLANYGLDNAEIEDIQKTFQAFPRTSAPVPPDGSGEVGRLIAEFDCTSLEVGLIRFDPQITELNLGFRFGVCEADPLVIVKDGSVVMYDHSGSPASLLHCALDSELFLDALAVFVEIRARKKEWKGRQVEATKKCCAASGDPNSINFYGMLCSFLG